jgi:hypothetical protein
MAPLHYLLCKRGCARGRVKKKLAREKLGNVGVKGLITQNLEENSTKYTIKIKSTTSYT